MNWLRKWLNKRHDEKCVDRPMALNVTASSGTKVRSHYEDDTSIQFRIYNANGGKIVETTSYDKRISRETTQLYIINDDEDFTTSLGKIVTMEFIR